MYPDWVAGKPIAIWFKAKSDYFLIGPLLAKEWMQNMATYGGIIFDLLIAPGLIWKKTRKYAFIASIFFHLFNSAVFQVGIFPYMGISFALFFYQPETIRRIFLKRKPALDSANSQSVYGTRPVLAYVLSFYLIFQALLPLRHWLYEGDVAWTEEGHRLSWRMMLRVKSGYVNYLIKDPNTGEEWKVDPKDYLTRKQAGQVASRPDACWQFVQILKEDFKKKGLTEVEIYATGKVSLNGGPLQPLYDSSVNLADVEWQPFTHASWLLPINR